MPYAKLMIALLFVVSTNLLHAQLQSTYTKGKIELQNGKTMEGFVRDDELSKMIYKINFKAKKEDKQPTVYDTSQVQSVTMEDGQIFQLIRVKPSDDPDTISTLATLLIKGKATLYSTYFKGDKTFVVIRDNKMYVLQDDKLDAGTMSTEVTHHNFNGNLLVALSGTTIPRDRIDRTSFNEKDITQLISDYNKSENAENTIMNSKRKTIAFVIPSVGGMIKNSEEHEFYFQAFYRIYFPEIDRGTSLNIGLSYLNYKFPASDFYYSKNHYTVSIYSIPIQLQQNLLNKNIRPYFFGGLNLSRMSAVNDDGVEQLGKGFQKNFGLGLLYGGGVEASIFKGLLVKGEYRYENISHLVLAGIGYALPVNKR